MSDGRDYEIFVQSLHQAILNSEQWALQQNIRIERNKIIKDNLGIDREFDLYWEYELGGLRYKTIIECKDYSSKISIEKIDALIGKVQNSPDLKPVVATKTGYQIGALRKAEKYGIELLIVREQRDEDWQDLDGNPLIREVNIHLHLSPAPRILSFRPKIDAKWVVENTQLRPAELSFSRRMNNEIFIEDLEKNETYSLKELAGRLDSVSGNQFGELIHRESFKQAFLLYEDLRLKMTSYEVSYARQDPVEETIHIDISKELIGVIEYLSKRSTTAVFKDRVMNDWHQ